MLIDLRQLMRVLEARFYPRSKRGGEVVVVGRITCANTRPVIEPMPVPADAVRPFHAGGLLAKLRFLVERAGPQACAELPQLNSEYWSFVPIESEPRQAGES